LKLDGEEGMEGLSGLYMKFPGDEFLKHLGNNRYLNDLKDAFKNWKKMNFISPRTAIICASMVGDQGIFQCKCKGKCMTNQCKCFKKGRICTSAYHQNSKCCKKNDHVMAVGEGALENNWRVMIIIY
jgi:hypothetical protein